MQKQRDLLTAFLSAVLGVYLVLQLAGSGAVAWKFVIVLGLATLLITAMQKTVNIPGFRNRIKWYGFLLFLVVGMTMVNVVLGDLNAPDKQIITSPNFWVFGMAALWFFVSLEVNEL